MTDKSPNMMGLNTNLANGNHWIAYFPLEDFLGKKYKNIELHLTRFSLPQMVMGTMQASYKGYQKEVPNKIINSDTKELTLEYLVDQNWNNYKCLYKWMSGIYGTLNPTIDTSDINGINPTNYIPLRIYLLDNYKKKVIQFFYQNTFIKMFNDLALEASNPEEVTHSVTLSYDNFFIEDID